MINRKKISEDILRYFAEIKCYSSEEMAAATCSPINHIENIKNGLEFFTSADINNYLNNEKLKFWEFAIKAIALENLPEETRKKVLFCHLIFKQINNKQRKDEDNEEIDKRSS